MAACLPGKSANWPQARGAAVGAALPSCAGTKPLRGGKDRGIDHEPSTSATRSLDSEFAPHLYRRAVPCYSRAWRRLAAVSARFLTSRPSSTLPKAPALPIYSIYIKAKAVPIAASSSEIASARPTGPEVRPRSFMALRIQDSAEDAFGEPPDGDSAPAHMALVVPLIWAMVEFNSKVVTAPVREETPMLMSSADYRESLRRFHPSVFVNGRRVESVADDPALAPGINAIGITYDFALEQEHVTPDARDPGHERARGQPHAAHQRDEHRPALQARGGAIGLPA